MGSCGVFCAKYAVFTVNLVSVLIGLIFTVVGIVLFFFYDHHVNFTPDQLLTIPFILIIIGLVVILIALLGLCGAINRNSCITFTFSNLLIILLILQLGIGSYGLVRQDQANDVWDKVFNETLNKYEIREEVTHIWNFMQWSLQCCGSHGPDDWININKKIPWTCCKDGNSSTPCENAYEIGCKSALFDFFQSHYITFVAILIVVSGIQVLLIGWSCFLYGAFSREKHYSSIESNLDRYY